MVHGGFSIIAVPTKLLAPSRCPKHHRHKEWVDDARCNGCWGAGSASPNWCGKLRRAAGSMAIYRCAQSQICETPSNLRGTGVAIAPGEYFCSSLVARGGGAGDV